MAELSEKLCRFMSAVRERCEFVGRVTLYGIAILSSPKPTYIPKKEPAFAERGVVIYPPKDYFTRNR